MIPTIGRWDLLIGRAWNSVLLQTHKNWEVIIVCDGVSIPPWAHKLNYGMDQTIKWISIPKRQHYPDEPMYHWLVGPSNALNVALEAATGDWIVRMDDDDELRPYMIEDMLRFANEHDYEFVSGIARGPSGPIVPYTRPVVGSVQTWMYRGYLKTFKYNLDSWRKAWDRNNDIDLPKRMHKAGVRFGFHARVVTDIKPRPGQKEIGSKAWLAERKERK